MNDLIKEARELCEKASPAPWKTIERGNSIPSHSVVTVPYDGNPMINICSGISPKTENAEFIARSRTLVPELADALEKTNKEVDRLSQYVLMRDGEIGDRDREIAQLREALTEICAHCGWAKGESPCNTYACYKALYTPLPASPANGGGKE